MHNAQGTLTYSIDWENKISKMFMTSLGNWTEVESLSESQAIYTLEHGLLN